MDLDRIQELIAEIAKNGDKQTIRNICELLSEMSRFKGKSGSVTESVQIPTPKNTYEHASLILDGADDKYVPKTAGAPKSFEMGRAADILG